MFYIIDKRDNRWFVIYDEKEVEQYRRCSCYSVIENKEKKKRKYIW